MADVNSLKDQGNKAFAAKEYDQAIDLFSQAIALDPKNHVLYSNRSAAKAGKRQWSEALADAEECINVNPKWAKGYVRKGAALHGARRYDEAIAAYEAGIAIEDSAPLQRGLKEVREAQEADTPSAGGGDDALGLGKMFSDPNLLGKLATNPRTSKHLADPAFVQKIRMIQQNPAMANTALQDPRMIDVLGVLMGIDIQGFSRPEGSEELPEGIQRADSPPSSPPPPRTSTSAKPPPPEPPKEEPMEVDDDDTTARKEAESEKAKGNVAYKQRDFAAAAKCFEKAWEVWPKDITFLTNLAAVYFEQGEYDKCISTCETAVDEGRSLRADYKLVAKAYGRIGSAYLRKDDLQSAVKFFEKSLTEHRTPDILNKLRDAQRIKAERDRQAYIDPEQADKAREEGNAFFKAADFAGAVKAYTESIKRNPSDARGYNNRANAYTKLLALPDALKDAEKAIELDPKFVKAYLRKSYVLFAMREYTKAIDAAEEASAVDTDHKNASEIQQQVLKCNQALYEQRSGETDEQTLERAMRDPEVASIMSDPVMQQILQQAQQNPASLQDHMKNPMIRQKIQKLVNSGVLRTR